LSHSISLCTTLRPVFPDHAASPSVAAGLSTGKEFGTFNETMGMGR
jgi:hypothetical protein